MAQVASLGERETVVSTSRELDNYLGGVALVGAPLGREKSGERCCESWQLGRCLGDV